MKYLIATLFLVSMSSYAEDCRKISGTYKSVSETHWNFEVSINGEKAVLTYTNYISGRKETRTDERTVSKGYCEANQNEYTLTFAEKSVSITYHPELSRASFGAQGHSPGITGAFLSNKTVELWLNQ
jgi:hypothetical protein